MLSAKREPRKILLCFNCDSGMVWMSFFLAHEGVYLPLLPSFFTLLLPRFNMDFSFTVMRFVEITESMRREGRWGVEGGVGDSWIKQPKSIPIRPKCYKYGFAYLCWAFISLGFIQLMRYLWAGAVNGRRRRRRKEKRQNQNHKNLVKNYHYTVKLLLMPKKNFLFHRKIRKINISEIP